MDQATVLRGIPCLLLQKRNKQNRNRKSKQKRTSFYLTQLLHPFIHIHSRLLHTYTQQLQLSPFLLSHDKEYSIQYPYAMNSSSNSSSSNDHGEEEQRSATGGPPPPMPRRQQQQQRSRVIEEEMPEYRSVMIAGSVASPMPLSFSAPAAKQSPGLTVTTTSAASGKIAGSDVRPSSVVVDTFLSSWKKCPPTPLPRCYPLERTHVRIEDTAVTSSTVTERICQTVKDLSFASSCNEDEDKVCFSTRKRTKHLCDTLSGLSSNRFLLPTLPTRATTECPCCRDIVWNQIRCPTLRTEGNDDRRSSTNVWLLPWVP